ncbi:KPN_02809 family neutral zinc metallopeptidase [Salinibacterium hongtaonis]|uniref:Neutral zinc metallopeptidase n=1 Tax=Homoserinimonas hongtaonis TaxID=2079791 RepID=A0A2U1T101_9MICO|nr:neutral zinc metallopeptidase [Salinibacterium hongtaonis]PWB97565.1 neutral zinc metallopeptidase [Salinibacterium hongtaonis]
MTFNDNARSSGSRVSKRGRNTGLAVGGGGVGLIVILLVSSFLGVDLSGLVGGDALGGGGAASQDSPLEGCETGADANAVVECRLDFTAQSLDDFWAQELGSGYSLPEFVLFEQSVSTACGSATSAVGPFYCPGDSTVYLDVSFYDELRSRFGAEGGPLAQMYVVGHEWGHHIQNITGVMDRVKRGDSGPTSDSVRLELQADCLAGAWVGGASSVPDANGQTLLEPVTRAQVQDALNAASVIGDDRIQSSAGGEVDPHTWTHGSSEQRQRWFEAGYEGGTGACDTFAAQTL